MYFLSLDIMTAKRELFIWKNCHESLLLSEVVHEEPYKYNAGTKERGAAWSKIADSLNERDMKVTQRSAREKFDKMYKEFKEREKEEKLASGVEVEYDENYQALTEIHDRIIEWEEARQAKETTEKVIAEEMRKRATEKFSTTKKRKADVGSGDESEEDSPPKKRQSQTNLVEVMNQSVLMKRTDQQEQRQLRQRELDMRAAELQQQQQFQNHLLQQQQQFQQQQQAMNMAMFNALNEMLKHIRK